MLVPAPDRHGLGQTKERTAMPDPSSPDNDDDNEHKAKRSATKKAGDARYRAAHADKIKAHRRAYYLANREALLAKQRAYDTAQRAAAKLRRQGSAPEVET
jgi:hypothetical protein